MVARIGSWKDNNLQMKCAREAVKLIKEYISNGISFNQETTLAGKTIINNIKLAKAKGYYICMNYKRRYYYSLKNLKEVVGICDEINIYDNTEMFREVINYDNGHIVWNDDKLPKWTQIIIENKI